MASRAVVVSKNGGPDVLEVRERDVPVPGAGEIVVNVAASGINYVDVYKREGFYPTSPPFVLGEECAGTVVAVGPDTSDFAVGDAVATAKGNHGTHAEHAVLDAAMTVPMPSTLDPVLAAAVMLQGITAHYLVNSTFPLAAGDVAVVHAAAGGVGHLLVQMAKAKGARVIATAGSAKKVEIAAEFGADEVIRNDEVDDLAAAIRDAAGQRVDVVYDGVGAATFDASLASLRPRGMLVLFGASSGQVPPFDLQRLNSGGSLFVTRPTMVHYIATREELSWRADEVLGAVASGALRVDVGGRYSFDEAAQAYRDLESRRTIGKLLVIP